jgi:hypothetical protein
MQQGGRFSVAFVGAFLAILAGPCRSDSTLDQINEILGGSGPEAHAGRMLAQTVTVGVSGTLVLVDMWLWDPGPATKDLVVEIWPTQDGLPSVGALAQVTVPAVEIQNYNSRVYTRVYLADADLRVVEGDVLAIVLRTEAPSDPGGFDWWGNDDASDGLYARGDGFQSYDGGVTWLQISSPDWDFMFRTYVDPELGRSVNGLFEALLGKVNEVGPGASLAEKISVAQTYYDVQATCAMLDAFVNQVEAQSGKQIASDTAGELLMDAQEIMGEIGCE